MKKMTMKKLLALGCAFVLGCSMLGCSGKTEEPAAPESTESPADTESPESDAPAADNNSTKDSYNIAIVKQMDHASLDEIANAVAAELEIGRAHV